MINWNSSILWGILGLIGGGITSFTFFTLSNKTKRIVYQIKSNPLISDKLSQIKGLKITFMNAEIPNLISSTVIVANGGSDTLELNDFAHASPLTIKTDGNFLVYDNANSFITSVSNTTSSTTLIQTGPDEIKINFDYWAKNDSNLFTILHTGNLSLAGTLKKGKIIENGIFNKKKKFYNTILIIAGVILAILLLGIRGLTGSINTIYNLFLNIGLGYILIDYAQKKLRQVEFDRAISINGQSLDNFTIITGKENNVIHNEKQE